ncbi:hypothetical protein AB0P21_39905 [Kribbella sp. NPDC056861]|uniref:hypothetical protein n=1 Tax=Kribbella sp. NPDC056861 TaxID=3154857 RepID=UPI00342BB102
MRFTQPRTVAVLATTAAVLAVPITAAASAQKAESCREAGFVHVHTAGLVREKCFSGPAEENVFLPEVRRITNGNNLLDVTLQSGQKIVFDRKYQEFTSFGPGQTVVHLSIHA